MEPQAVPSRAIDHLRLVTVDEVVTALRSAVQEAGSQKRFCDCHGISPGDLSNALSGTRRPTKALMRAVGVIAVPGDDQGAGIYGNGTSYEGAVNDAYEQSGTQEPTVYCRDEDGTWFVRNYQDGSSEAFNDETSARDYAAQNGFIARPCTERLYQHVKDHGAPVGTFRWSQKVGEIDDLDEAETDVDETDTTIQHIDPTDSAVAAILALDLDSHGNDLRSIAAALQPHVAAAPALPTYSEDDVWTAAEEAVAAAMTIVHGVQNRKEETKDWWRLFDQVNRLRDMQRAHRANLVSDRIGTFPGFKASVKCRWCDTPSIWIYPANASADFTNPILELDPDLTRRKIEMAIFGWVTGNQ